MTSPGALAATSRHTESPDWLDPATGHSAVVVGKSVAAVAMRAGLGAEVSFHLSTNGFTGPVLRYPARPFTKWIFLTDGHCDIRRSTAADLLTSHVHLVREGTTLVLPPWRCALGAVSWVVTPNRDTLLFPLQSVLSAVRATSGSHW